MWTEREPWLLPGSLLMGGRHKPPAEVVQEVAGRAERGRSIERRRDAGVGLGPEPPALLVQPQASPIDREKGLTAGVALSTDPFFPITPRIRNIRNIRNRR